MITYTYDSANRLTQITQGSSIVQLGYDTANRRTSLTLPNNLRVEYGYDAASRVTSITYKQNGTTLLGDLTYEYDKAGNRTKTGGSWARTGMPEPVTSTSYDAANRQLTFGDKSLTYDDNGNLQSITDSNGTTLYQWNARNQLVGITGPTVNASFLYDGLGRREAKTINGSLTEFLYDGINPVQESAGATVLANILSGLDIDEFLTRTDVAAAETSNFLTDAIGSPVAVANNAGAVQSEYTYESFGRPTTTGASNTNSYQYTGRENDGTGLYFYRARYHNPTLGRFVSEDPIEITDASANRYVFVRDNPINNVDPLGLYVGAVGGAFIGATHWPSAGPGAVGASGFAGLVNDSNGDLGFMVCAAVGPAGGTGAFAGVGSINNWGAKTICDVGGVGAGAGYGGGGKQGIAGGGGLGAFIEISLQGNAVASGFGYGVGGFTWSGGLGGCIVYPITRPCPKCPR